MIFINKIFKKLSGSIRYKITCISHHEFIYILCLPYEIFHIYGVHLTA